MLQCCVIQASTVCSSREHDAQLLCHPALSGIFRLVLEARLPHGVAEGLLVAPGGRLLEGLITNLFVVVGA